MEVFLVLRFLAGADFSSPGKMLHISCNIGTHDLYALSPWAYIRIRQITLAYVTTITYCSYPTVATYT